MTDKELFEKTEKTFNLNKKNTIIESVYEKGKFKSLLENTSPIGSNYGGNTISATATAGRGLAKTGGAIARGLGALGKFAREVIPGTRASRMRTAETQKQEAQARAEELKNMQMRQKLASGDDDDTKKQHKMDEYVEKIYNRNPQFAASYDKVLKGETLNRAEQIDYDDGLKEADNLRKGVDVETAQQQAKAKIGEEKLLNLDTKARGLAIYLRDPNNEKTKLLFQKYVLQDPPTTEEENKLLAGGLIQYFYKNYPDGARNKKDFIALTNYFKAQEKLKSLQGGASIMNSIGIKIQKPKKTTKPGELSAEDQKLINNVQTMADQAKIKLQDQLMVLNKEADKFKVGDIVVGTAGARHKITGKDSKTGTVEIKSLVGNKPSKRFAKDLEIDQKEFNLNSNEESFEQIVKRYR